MITHEYSVGDSNVLLIVVSPLLHISMMIESNILFKNHVFFI